MVSTVELKRWFAWCEYVDAMRLATAEALFGWMREGE